jgi:excisionase family DNA binding protein
MKTSLRRRTTPVKSKMVDLHVAAKILELDPMTLFKMVRRGEVSGAVKIGFAWRFDRDELQRFLETRPLESK